MTSEPRRAWVPALDAASRAPRRSSGGSTRRSSAGPRSWPRSSRRSSRHESRGAAASSRSSARPGIGKTRLGAELCTASSDDATVLVGRCVSYGQGATYLPLSEMLAQAGGRPRDRPRRRRLDRRGAARPARLTSSRSPPRAPARARVRRRPLGRADAARPRRVARGARRRGADPDPLPRAAGAARAAPGWPVELELGPLGARQTWRRCSSRSPATSGRSVRARIVEIAEGNPLYAEQLLAYAREGGSLEAVPPSVEALLASRLDRLEPGERAVLQRAAVDRARVRPQHARAPCRDRTPPRGRRPARRARTEQVSSTGRRARLPVPPRPHPGRRLRGPAEGRARGAARAARRLARRRRRGPTSSSATTSSRPTAARRARRPADGRARRSRPTPGPGSARPASAPGSAATRRPP